VAGEFKEISIPPVLWLLYGIAGFALTCMGASAAEVLADLARSGSVIDLAIVWMLATLVIGYLAVGIRLALVRKFVVADTGKLVMGYSAALWRFKVREIIWSQVSQVMLVNQSPTPNLAPHYHGDRQFFIRGHWRVVVELKDKNRFTLDTHTEKDALMPLFTHLESSASLKSTTTRCS